MLKNIEATRISIDVVQYIGLYFRNYLLHECNIFEIKKNETVIKILSFLLDIFVIDE